VLEELIITAPSNGSGGGQESEVNHVLRSSDCRWVLYLWSRVLE
jgi:hypothetical protein